MKITITNIYTIKEAEDKLTELTGNESKIEVDAPSLVKSAETFKEESNIFNSDAEPIIPNGYNWNIEEHKKGGSIDISKIVLYLDKKQDNDSVEGNKLRKLLSKKSVLNANVLDYLLAHPELIPESWKGKAIFFWGTIYRSSGGGLCVRCLFWDGSKWCWDYGWLDSSFCSSGPAALAS